MDHDEAFRAAARADGITAAEVDAWLATTRFCVELNSGGDGPVAGRIGGSPVMPDDVPWPRNPDGADLEFLACVECAALPRDAGTDVHLPADGRLLFFLSYDDDLAHDEQANSRVLHVPAEGRERVPEEPFDRVDLVASVRFSRDYSGEDGEDDYESPLTELARTFWPEVFQPGPDCLRIGGYGDAAHAAPEEAVLEVLAEQGLEPDGERVRREWVPLAQFGHPNRHWSLVDARFMIRRTDLAEGRFDRVVCTSEFGG